MCTRPRSTRSAHSAASGLRAKRGAVPPASEPGGQQFQVQPHLGDLDDVVLSEPVHHVAVTRHPGDQTLVGESIAHRLPGLSSSKYDAGASAFTVTKERRKEVDCVTYLGIRSGLAVKQGNPRGPSLDDPATLCGHPGDRTEGLSRPTATSSWRPGPTTPA